MLYNQLNRQKERQTSINQTHYINIKHQIEICIKLLSFVICPRFSNMRKGSDKVHSKPTLTKCGGTKSVKVSRSRNKNCRAVTFPKNEWTNLFFYPDSPEILETWISRFPARLYIKKSFETVSILKSMIPPNFENQVSSISGLSG